MDTTYLIILIAASVAALVFALSQVAASLLNADRRKLQERLVSSSTQDSGYIRRSIIMQNEVEGLARRFANVPGVAELHRRLLQGYPNLSLERFLGIAVAAAVGGFLVLTAITGSLFLGLMAAVAGGVAPLLLLTRQCARRQRMMTEQLPEALDFLSRILRAGHSLSTGLQMISEELPQPLAGEFRRAYDQHSLGQNLEESLKDIARRVKSTDFAFFVTAVMIQRQTGGDLAEVLGNISGMIRQRMRLQQHVKAKTAEGRFTGYILTAFPGAVFLLCYWLNPEYCGMLLNDSTGLTLLGLAAGLSMIGLLAIKKITTVKV
jgi:tight adherence protein B